MRQAVKDSRLFIVIFILIIVDTVILIMWLLVNPLHWKLITVPNQVGVMVPLFFPEGAYHELYESLQDSGKEQKGYICTCSNGIYWSGLVYAFKGISYMHWEISLLIMSHFSDSFTFWLAFSVENSQRVN